MTQLHNLNALDVNSLEEGKMILSGLAQKGSLKAITPQENVLRTLRGGMNHDHVELDCCRCCNGNALTPLATMRI